MSYYFYGWYLKAQSDTQTLAVIPAVHKAGNRRTCSIQLLTEEHAWKVSYPGDIFEKADKIIYIGESRFGEQGMYLNIEKPDLRVKGVLEFGALTPPKYDIMGPFSLVPFMECRHSVWSMKHLVNGEININGQEYQFENAYGYWEGDRGGSFPKKYLWTQCFFREGSLMLSAADIPVAGTHFTGIIGVVLWKGKEYRIATYLGARVIEIRDGMVRVRQGKYELEARILEKKGQGLRAPAKGDMVRTIYENAACWAVYRLKKAGKVLFAFETKRASFEWEYFN